MAEKLVHGNVFEGYEPPTAESVGLFPENGRILVEYVRFEMPKPGQEDIPPERRIFLDATTEEGPEHAVVVAVAGDICQQIEPGEVVFVGRYSGYNIEQERFGIVRWEDVVGRCRGGRVRSKKGHRPDSGLALVQSALITA